MLKGPKSEERRGKLGAIITVAVILIVIALIIYFSGAIKAFLFGVEVEDQSEKIRDLISQPGLTLGEEEMVKVRNSISTPGITPDDQNISAIIEAISK